MNHAHVEVEKNTKTVVENNNTSDDDLPQEMDEQTR